MLDRACRRLGKGIGKADGFRHSLPPAPIQPDIAMNANRQSLLGVTRRETPSTPTILFLLGGFLILISYGLASLWLAVKEYVQ